MLLSRLLLLTEKWQKLKTIRLLIYGSRPRKWKQFAYSKYIRTNITIRKFLFKRELAGSGKIAAYNDFTNVLLRYGRVGSYRLKQKSVSSLRTRLGFNGTLVNKQKQTKILFLLGALWDDGRTKFHIWSIPWLSKNPSKLLRVLWVNKLIFSFTPWKIVTFRLQPLACLT